MSTILELDPRQTIIVAIFVLFLGKYLTSKVEFLREYNIPGPVSGGLIASLVFGAFYAAFELEFQFALDLRDTLLIVFFTTIGLSSRFSTLVEGGKPLLILLVVAVAYLFVQTFTGLAGFGDLFTTCVSPHGRNRGVGERIGTGESVDAILLSMTSVAEGVPTTRAVLEQARQIGVEMPITEALYGILFNGLDPQEAITSLMTRATRPE